MTNEKELTPEQKKLVDDIENECQIELMWAIKNEMPATIDDFIEYCEDRINEIEVTYYATAMQYLSERDDSLRESLDIAKEYGIEIDNINSELLATLLTQQDARESLHEYRDDIEELFYSDNEDVE